MTKIMRGADLKSLPAGQIFYQGTLSLRMISPCFPPCICVVVCTLSHGNVYTKVESSAWVLSSKQSFLMGICYCTSAILFLWFFWVYHHRNNSTTLLYNFFSEKYLKLLYKKERVGTQASRPGEELSAPSTSHRLQIVVLFFYILDYTLVWSSFKKGKIQTGGSTGALVNCAVVRLDLINS